jgi:phosphonate transport system ATP-binding protein
VTGTGPAVSLRGVRVELGTNVALDGFDLEVGAGQRVALVGPSGAGKTTALRLCNATVAPAAGTVTVLGTDLATAGPRELRAMRRRVGTVYQQLDLVGPVRVVHNVNAGRLGWWGRGRALRSLVRPVEVDAARAALAQVGIAGKLFERTDALSGGEQQRVALARVLVQRPDLVLADEPVSSLDPARAGEVMDLLAAVASGGEAGTGDGRPAPALLVSLHDFDLARERCDRVVGVRAGRVVFDLPAAEVTDEMGSALYRIAAR